MSGTKEIPQALSLIQSHFSLSEGEIILHEYTFKELEAKLSKVISFMLNKDMEKLLQVFYRIDLDEHTFKKILTQEASENIGLKLAREVIKRELEKVKTREKYKNF